MAVTLKMAKDYELTTCPQCGVMYAVPAPFLAARRKDRGTFFCPNGHSAWFGPSEADQLRAKLADTEKRLREAQELLGMAEEPEESGAPPKRLQ